MGRTVPRTWPRGPRIAAEIKESLYSAYLSALADQGNSSSVEDEAYHAGVVESLEWVLDLIHKQYEHKEYS